MGLAVFWFLFYLSLRLGAQHDAVGGAAEVLSHLIGVWGLGFGVWGLGFGVWGLGFGVWGLGFGFLVWRGYRQLEVWHITAPDVKLFAGGARVSVAAKGKSKTNTTGPRHRTLNPKP